MALTKAQLLAAPTAVYRLYDASGALLYVGITRDLEARWVDHRRRDWWPLVASKEIRWHVDRAGALAEEAVAIRTELPLHNVAGTPRVRRREHGPRLTGACRADRHKSPRRKVGIEDADWHELGSLVGSRNRADVVALMVEAFLKRPRARMPKRSDYEGRAEESP